MLILILLVLVLSVVGTKGNSPPRFQIQGGQGSQLVLQLKEGDGAKPGTRITRIRGFDPDGDSLTFGVVGDQNLVQVEQIDSEQADVVLLRELDHEEKRDHEIILTLTDGHLGEGRYITQSLLILVEDANDNPPVFSPPQISVEVAEHVSNLVLATLSASDLDSGAFGQVVYRLLPNQEPEISEKFSVTTKNGAAVLNLISELNYESRNLYEVLVEARDRSSPGDVNTATATVVVKVLDIPDQGPEWISLKAVTRIPEDISIFSPVLTVRAMDGDRGIRNKIKYGILNGNSQLFGINPQTGLIYTKDLLDRENAETRNGAFILEVSATEISEQGSLGQTVTTEITIILEDVNDEIPQFRASSIIAEIAENSPSKTPLTILGENNVTEVFDLDQGTNGTFILYLENGEDVFEVTPTSGLNEASFILRVRNPSLLDYETQKIFNLSLVAEEVASTRRRSRIPVTVLVRDQNDHFPKFSSDNIEIYIPESLTPGEVLTTVTATDADSGVFGSDGIRYTEISGPISEFLGIDPVSGKVVLKDTEFRFDREKVSTHYLSIAARDNLGQGNRNTAQLVIHVEDINDSSPTFSQIQYEAYISENSLSFAEPLVVRAEDEDEKNTSNSEIRYQIIPSLNSDNFTIDSVTGEILPSGFLDFESVPISEDPSDRTILVRLRAFDLGTPSLSGVSSVLIHVIDMNDNPPEFLESSYEVSIPEDIEAGSPILSVKARDADGSSPNNEIVYRLDSESRDKFYIDGEIGMISVLSGNLDPDLSVPPRTRYSLQVLALDGGLGHHQLSARVLVNVTITDVNNKPPIVFQLDPVSVREDADVGSMISSIKAKDPDKDSQLRFNIDFPRSEGRDEDGRLVKPEQWQSMIECDQMSGEIRVLANLDRELVQELYLYTVVEDISATREKQITSSRLTVHIADVNDNDPLFDKQIYRGSVVENSQRDTPVLSVLARDKDVNRTISYTLQGDLELLNLIQVDQFTGQVSVRNRIDREVISWLNLTVVATDSASPPRSGSALLLLKVLDENDNSPVFINPPSVLEISEGEMVGSRILQLQAQDRDEGQFGTITFSIDPVTSLGAFQVHPDTGEVTVAKILDREEKSSYNLIVQAHDNYQFGFVSGESRVSYHKINIQIGDINDEAPEFVEVPDTCTSIVEFHTEEILTLRALDKDDPETPNGEIDFKIVHGNEMGFFRIEQVVSGIAKLYPEPELNGKPGNYSVLVEAEDRGFPANSASAVFLVCVQDFNDHAPEFILPSSNYTVRILENATIGTEVLRVQAVDEDNGLNGEVRYRIRKDSSGNHEIFEIDPVTGAISLTKTLDRERTRMHELRIEAYDLGVPTPLQSDLDLMIYVQNVNDHEPQFIVDEFSVNFTENESGGSEIRKILNTIDLDEEEAGDEKIMVCYYIVSGNSEGIFHLDSVSHEIIVVKPLDREEKISHVLIIKATEDCGTVPGEVLEFNPLDNTLLLLNIIVVDVNDNAPVFERRLFTGGVSTDLEFGTKFMSVKATDSDSGINSQIEYSICGQVELLNSEGFGENEKAPFLVEPDTGEVVLNFDPQENQKGYFSFEVCARDIDGKEDTAKVVVYLLREDQRVKFVTRSQPQELRLRMDEFSMVLANATGAIVNLDYFKVHGNNDGSVDKTKTDVFLHFVHPENNTVMEVSDILRTIDYKTIELDSFFKEFDVLQTEGSANYLPIKMETSETVIISWLVGVSAFLSLLLLVVVCICVSQRSKYSRKLKAVTTDAYDTAPKITKKDEFVPNTNRHASEGSNPIWMTGLDPSWEIQTHPEGSPRHVSEIFSNLDSLDTNVLNEPPPEPIFQDESDGSIEVDRRFFMTGEVLYRSNDEDDRPREGSAGRRSDSSGRGSLFTSSHFVQSIKDESLLYSKPFPERLNNPRASSQDRDSD